MKTQGRNGNNAHKARHATAGKAGKACRVLLAVIMAISLCPGFRALADQPDGREAGGDTFTQEVGDIGTGAQGASDGAGAAVGDTSAMLDASGEANATSDAFEGAGSALDAIASLNQGTSTAIQPADVSGGLIDFGQPDDSLADGTEGVEGPQTTDELVPADADATSESDEPQPLVYEDDVLYVTAEAPAGVFPEGAYLEVDEVLPIDYESSEAYAEALTALSDTLRAEDKTYTSAKVYDIRIMLDGVEIEPGANVNVTLTYKDMKPLVGESAEATADVAHIDSNGNLALMNADIAQDEAGAVESASFTTDSFSYYIVFGTNQGSEQEPVHFDPYGWLKFSTPEDEHEIGTDGNVVTTVQWGHYQSESELPATNSEEGYHRILQVNLHTLRTGGTEGSYDEVNYEPVSTNQYFWTWENSIFISDFNVPDFEVTQTKMHTAWDDPSNDIWQDSLVGPYSVRGYRSSDGTSKQLNVLDVYMKRASHSETAMRYIVRYVHADGSVTDGNVRYLSSGNEVIDVDKPRAGEVFSGISVAAGAEAVTADTANKQVTFTYDPKVNLAKAYVYFENEPESNGVGSRANPDKGYDKIDGKYYNGAKGLYTDKTAEEVNDREFLVNLEAWYIDNAASVGMVLDASGSMAWTAGVPVPYELSDDQVSSIDVSKNSWTNPLSETDVNKLLDRFECDNSYNGYNGYKYYVYTRTVATSNPINEYAALGYTYSNTTSTSETQINLGSPAKGKADAKNTGGPGWYFVNSATNYNHYNDYGAKRYEGRLDSGGGPCRFYVKYEDEKYYLYCRFSQGSNADADHPGMSVQESRVYIKRDQMMTKSETLQDSIAQFGSILNGASPESEMSMVRFSHTNFQQNLVLLNWTKESEKIAAAMNLTPNGPGGPARADGTYQYGITGGTKARFGFNEYNSKLKGYADANNYKYLILFTDGKDQGTSDTEKTTKAWLNTTFPGYTIITMFMRSVGMPPSDVAASRDFLKGLASGGKNGDPNQKLYFEANSDDAHEVVNQFRDIAEFIVTGLHDYSVRDYIDPRFDVVNEAGQVLSVLDENGEFKKATNPDVDDQGFRGFTTPDGKQALLGYDKEREMFYVLWQHQEIQASALGGTGKDSPVYPWKSQIRLTAKKDFIGGNDVLTNGNTSTDNLVYKPQMETKTVQEVDSDGNIVSVQKDFPKYDSQGRELVDDTKTKKSFPFASVNPGLLDVKLGNYEDTVYLGERIAPGDLLSLMMENPNIVGTNGEAKTGTAVTDRGDASHRVADTMYNADELTAAGDTDLSSRYYIEYLERLGKKLHNDRYFYGTLLRQVNLHTAEGITGVHELITALQSNTNYTVTEASGSVKIQGKANTAAAGEVIEITKSGGTPSIKLTLPYYYLESPTDPTSFAGPDTTGVDPQDDKVGTLTYTWEMKDFASNTPSVDTKDEENKFVEFDTYIDRGTHMDTAQDVKYQFRVSYVPEAVGDAASGDDGSTRTKALTNQANVQYPKIRDAVGNVRSAGEGQSTTDQMGWAVIHVVDGRLLIEKKMLTSDLEKAQARGITGTMSFTLTGGSIALSAPENASEDAKVTLYKGADNAWVETDETVWTKSLTLDSSTTGTVDGDYTVLFSEWVTGLPQGTYTLAETTTGGVELESIEGSDDVVFWTDANDAAAIDPAKPYSTVAANFAVTYSGSTWTFGSSPKKTHTDYLASDYTFKKVADTLADNAVSNAYKGTDAKANSEAGGWAKDYLNAQIGRAIVKNKLATTSIDVSKTWNGDAPSTPIVVKLTGNDSSATTYFVELKAPGWSATVSNILPDGTVFTAQEGTGTIAADGTCSDFSAFSETEAYTLGSNPEQYKFESRTYSNKEGAELPGGVPARDAPKAGAVAFVNKEITQVTVEKTWEGVTPETQIAVKLTGTDGTVRFAQLDTSTWSHTFTELPAKTGLTYTAVEGTGAVLEDGTCPSFRPFPTDAPFTFDGKTYQLKSQDYFDAGASTKRAADNLDGGKSPDAGKVVFTNEALTKVEVEKAWGADVDDADKRPVYVQLYKNNTAEGAPVQLQSGAWTHAWENLKVESGVTYTVKEGQLSSGVFEPYEGTFTMNGKKMHQTGTDLYADPGKTTSAESLDGSKSPYAGKAVITNDLVLAKINLLKVEAAHPDKTIDGVTFTLLQDANTPVSGNPTYEKATDTTAVTGGETLTTAGGGKLKLPDLAPGAYWLLEKSVPAGYVMRDAEHPIGIVVSEEGVVTLVDDPTFVRNMAPELTGPDKGEYQLQVPNMRTYALPAAGGLGEMPFLFLGAFLAALAVGGFRTLRRPLAAARAGSRAARGRR